MHRGEWFAPADERWLGARKFENQLPIFHRGQPMSVRETNKIDFMSLDEKTNTFWLCMSEERPWTQTGPDYTDLKSKLNTYVGYAQSGQMHKDVPQSQGKNLGLRLMCGTTPSDDARHLLSIVKATCQRINFKFVVLVQEGETFREVPIEVGRVTVESGKVTIRPSAAPHKPWWKFW